MAFWGRTYAIGPSPFGYMVLVARQIKSWTQMNLQGQSVRFAPWRKVHPPLPHAHQTGYKPNRNNNQARCAPQLGLFRPAKWPALPRYYSPPSLGHYLLVLVWHHLLPPLAPLPGAARAGLPTAVLAPVPTSPAEPHPLSGCLGAEPLPLISPLT